MFLRCFSPGRAVAGAESGHEAMGSCACKSATARIIAIMLRMYLSETDGRLSRMTICHSRQAISEHRTRNVECRQVKVDSARIAFAPSCLLCALLLHRSTVLPFYVLSFFVLCSL